MAAAKASNVRLLHGCVSRSSSYWGGGSDPPDPIDELRAELSVAGPEILWVKAKEEVDIGKAP